MQFNRFIISLIVGLIMGGATRSQVAVAAVSQQNTPQLRDIELFTTQSYGGWAGSGSGLTIETEAGFLPIDQGVVLDNGQPSLRLNVTGDPNAGGWWDSLVAGPGWETYSLEPYMANGALEFSVRGEQGGEDFTIGIEDVDRGRDPVVVRSDRFQVSQFVSITTEWQRVQIPLSSFTYPDGTFNSAQMSALGFGAATTQPQTVWIADIRFTSPDVEPSHPAIKLNQLGYRPESMKQAQVSGFADQLAADPGSRFAIYDAESAEVVYEGTLELVTDLDPIASGERVLMADFSDLDQTGTFYLAVEAESIQNSPPFSINESIYADLVIDSARYFYLQRSGIPLDATHAGPFARPLGHPQDAQALFRSESQAPRDVSGGWYDAGDQGKYTVTGATAISDLLWAFEFFPNQFPDNHLNIPESGNGVPDLLDEIRWELDWIMRMQDPVSGGFYQTVQPTTDQLPHTFEENRYIEDLQNGVGNIRPTSVTANAAAALAHAAIVFEPFDPDYAAQLQSAAEIGYSYLEENPDFISTVDGAYGDWDDRDNRLWAAAALYRLTGDTKYHDEFKRLHTGVETYFTSTNDNAYSVFRVGMLGWMSYMVSDDLDPAAAALFEQQFTRYSTHMIERWESSTWNHTLLDEDYFWSSNFEVLTTPIMLYAGYRALGQETQAAELISQQGLDYLLGSNPLSLSYVTGYGSHRVENIYSVTWSNDGVEEIPAGVLTGGPNAYTNPLIYSNFAGKRYLDGNNYWTLNEHTITINAVLVFNAAMQTQGAADTEVNVVEPVLNDNAEPDVSLDEAAENGITEEEGEAIEEVKPEDTQAVDPETEPVIESAAEAVNEPRTSRLWPIWVAGSLMILLVGFWMGRRSSR